MRERLYITTEEYFALPYASNSGLKDAHKLMNARDEEVGRERSGYQYGSAIDALLTDPTLMDSTVLPEDDKKLLHPMMRSLNKNQTFIALFKPEGIDVPTHKKVRSTQVVWVNKEFPVSFDGMDLTIPGKAKFDLWNSKVNFGGDIKSTEARTREAFISGAKWFGYDQQAAWYMDMSESDRFVHFGISKWNFQIFEWPIKRDDDIYKSGREKYLRCLPSWWMLNSLKATKV